MTNSVLGNTKHGYTGHEEDTDTGLVYAEARYYNPAIGRFLSQDPSHLYLGHQGFTGLIGTERNLILSDPQQLNSYSYVRNNPINLTDPSGKWIPLIYGAAIALATYAPVIANWASSLVSAPVMTAIAIDDAQTNYEQGNYVMAGVALISAGELSGGTKAARLLQNSANGRIAEMASGIIKNTERIPSLNGTANYRIPDELNKISLTIGEVKNVKYLSLTRQLKDFISYAKETGSTLTLRVNESTRLSKSLKKALKTIKSNIKRIKKRR